MNYEYEYGRAKKKIETLQKQVEKMSDEAEGWKQVLSANDAILAAIVKNQGGEIEVAQDAINEALKQGMGLCSSYDKERGIHTITVAIPE